ncbi:uncharacterized protein ACRADG_000254 [Cochliomyia hominivorax]
MNRNFWKQLLLFLAVQHIYFSSNISADAEEDTWMDPDAWTRDFFSLNELGTTSGKCCKCQEHVTDRGKFENIQKEEKPKISEDSASLIYLKKLITMLFNKKYFRYDSALDVYKRSILFNVKSYELDKLEQLQDPRDLDNILANVFKNVHSPIYFDTDNSQQCTMKSSGLKTIVLDMFRDIWQLGKTSEIRFLFIVAFVTLIAWVLNSRTNISWLSLIFGGFFIYGYLHTYLECNRELEVNQMLDIINSGNDEEKVPKQNWLVKFVIEIFSGDKNQDLQKQKLKQSAKLSLGYCRPDHVLIMYFNDMFLKYLQILLEQFTATFTKLNSDLGFPYNIMSGILLACLIGYIIKLIFKYTLNPKTWVQILHRKQHYITENVSLKNRINSQDDRLSGENLKSFLNAINSNAQLNDIPLKLPKIAAVSGIEEVKEALEAPPKNIERDGDVSTKAQNNNNSNEKSLTEVNDVTLETLPDKL